MEWKESIMEHSAGKGKKWRVPLVIAGNELYENSLEIDCKWHYNGSGGDAFGGAEHWPYIQIEMALVSGEEELRDKIAEEFKDFCEIIIKKYSLNEKRKVIHGID